MLDKALDLLPWLWENFGMSGVIILLVCLAAFFALRAFYRFCFKPFDVIELQIAEQLSAIGGSDVGALITQAAQNDGNPRFAHVHDSLLRVGELYRAACAVRVPWLFRAFRKNRLAFMAARFIGIELLGDAQIVKLLRSFRARY